VFAVERPDLASHWPCATDFSGLSMHLRVQRLSKGDEHPTNTPHKVWYAFTLSNGGFWRLPYWEIWSRYER